MKHFAWFPLVLLTTLLVGCGGGKTYSVDPETLTSQFQGAPSNVQGEIDQAVASLKNNEFTEAVKAMQRAVEAGDLSEEQETAIFTIVQQIQQVMASQPDKNKPETHTAIRELAATIDPSLKTDPNLGRQPPPGQGQQ